MWLFLIFIVAVVVVPQRLDAQEVNPTPTITPSPTPDGPDSADLAGVFRRRGSTGLILRVRNQGLSTASGFKVRLYLERLTGESPTVRVRDVSVTSIAPGDVMTIKVPARWLTNLNQRVGAVIDWLSGVDETREDNNNPVYRLSRLKTTR